MSENDTDGTERDAALDEVAVTLVLEAGRRTMPLGELRGLGPGHTLTLDRRVVEGLDLMVGGRRVGRGRLVRVGDTLGVRLTQLFGGTAPEAASPAEPSPVAPAPAEPPPGGAEPSRAEPPVEAPPHGELRIHDTPDADT